MSKGMDWGLHDPLPGDKPILWAESDHEHDMMSTRMLGFWLYMLSDSLVFAALFTAYEVLSFPMSFAGGPTPRDVASPLYGYAETIVLFTSVLAYGMVMVNLKAERVRPAMLWLSLSLVVGLAFIGMEVHELQGIAAAGGPPQRSGFLSIFWAVVVVHGIHLAIGLLWMVVMFFQIARDGFTLMVTYRLANLKVYWLYQGLIWTFVYTFVYLRGSI
ncbi:cytochrome O ubiquinol oxidase [Lichenicola cladoniae]|uniref:Cytochrome O ubiquinol oxidase n=1 Tax=Lichenicola cladoniae TaxID=1484109 RepID=A0A6M8HQK4_9PROT|nr:cytochrome c oxidase subunit 3 [Lichenicola cladoniae]NPD68828.1 cytochrome O ubiquinol oxidase [Acetobacteraceae bacterium]QKE90753.1 cytochrome O ubiquinol oxidase [Lichenicola cladoniae]